MQIWQAEAHGTAFAHTEGLWCWADPSRQLSPTTDCSLPFSRTGRKEKKKKKHSHTHPTPKPTVQSNTCGLKYESTLIRKKKKKKKDAKAMAHHHPVPEQRPLSPPFLAEFEAIWHTIPAGQLSWQSPPQLRVRPPCCAQGANREGLDAAGQPSATALTGSFISAV